MLSFQACSYCLGISIVAWLYATAQVLRDVHRLGSGRDLIAARKASAVVDFAGDQVVGSSGARVCAPRRGTIRSDPPTDRQPPITIVCLAFFFL